jgi:hypothetical protein
VAGLFQTPLLKKDGPSLMKNKHCFSHERDDQPIFDFGMEKGILSIYRAMSKGTGVSWMNHPCQKVIFFMSGWSVLFFKRRRFFKKR